MIALGFYANFANFREVNQIAAEQRQRADGMGIGG
jgi:hypothetical protein